jgi:hypothetical protein
VVNADDQEPDEPALPATVQFVTLLGAIIVIGWVMMFFLLVKRW